MPNIQVNIETLQEAAVKYKLLGSEIYEQLQSLKHCLYMLDSQTVNVVNSDINLLSRQLSDIYDNLIAFDAKLSKASSMYNIAEHKIFIRQNSLIISTLTNHPMNIPQSSNMALYTYNNEYEVVPITKKLEASSVLIDNVYQNEDWLDNLIILETIADKII